MILVLSTDFTRASDVMAPDFLTTSPTVAGYATNTNGFARGGYDGVRQYRLFDDARPRS
jgi:hypothetical protein